MTGARRERLELLHSSRFDFVYQPETFTGKVVRRAAAAGKGGRPSHWQTCPSCDGGSRRNRFGKLEPCDVCNGTGRLRVDDYTGETVVTDDANRSLGELIRRDTKTVKCPDCQTIAGEPSGVVHGRKCRRCDGTGRAPIPGSWLSEPSDPDRSGGDAEAAMIATLERRQQLGSYREYDEALAGIIHHVNKPPVFEVLTLHATQTLRLLDELYLPPATRTEASLSTFEASLVELAFAYIDSRMPDPIRVPKAIVENRRELANRPRWPKGRALTGVERQRRDQQIRAWAKSGLDQDWIGRQTGLSVRQLREIINGKGVAA